MVKKNEMNALDSVKTNANTTYWERLFQPRHLLNDTCMHLVLDSQLSRPGIPCLSYNGSLWKFEVVDEHSHLKSHGVKLNN